MDRDLLMWVGASFYPTVQDFIDEASQLGVSKRLPSLPDDIESGSTRVFLVHKDKTKHGNLFGYFAVENIELIVKSKSQLDPYRKEFEDRVKDGSVNMVTVRDAMKEPMRGCGYRSTPGAIYLCSNAVVHELAQYADEVNIKGGLVVFPKPWHKYKQSQFRGFRFIDGKNLLVQMRSSKRTPTVKTIYTNQVDGSVLG